MHDGRGRGRRAGDPRARAARPAADRLQDAGHGRPDAAPAGPRARSRAAHHHDHRVRHHRVGGGRGQGGGVRLPPEGLLGGSAPGGGRARPAPSGPPGREPQPAPAAPAGAGPREHRGPQSGDGPGLRAGEEGGAVGGEHPDPRRVRHRQGADRARHPRQQPAREPAVRAGGLRVAAGAAPRVRALRSREGRVHRRGADQGRADGDRPPRARSSWTRSPSCPPRSR